MRMTEKDEKVSKLSSNLSGSQQEAFEQWNERRDNTDQVLETTLMPLWDFITKKAEDAGNVAKVTAAKTKLRADIMMIDREIKARQMKFGIELYNMIAPLAANVNFFSSGDTLTETIRPPLLTAQREIRALEIKQQGIRDQLAEAEERRKEAFSVPASTWQEKLGNAGKSATLGANEAKLNTDLSSAERQIQHHKEQFGLETYVLFVDLEDLKGWLPTDRNIRTMYDRTRQDVETMLKKKKDKQFEIDALEGPPPEPKADGQMRELQEEPLSPTAMKKSAYSATTPLSTSTTTPGTSYHHDAPGSAASTIPNSFNASFPTTQPPAPPSEPPPPVPVPVAPNMGQTPAPVAASSDREDNSESNHSFFGVMGDSFSKLTMGSNAPVAKSYSDAGGNPQNPDLLS